MYLMAMKAAASNRAPRGTKTLIQAFFSAAGEITEASRDAVVKAAFAGIRDELQAAREKAKAAREKARATKASSGHKAEAKKTARKTAKGAASAGPAARKAARKTPPMPSKQKKAAAKRGSAPIPTTELEGEQDQQTESSGDMNLG